MRIDVTRFRTAFFEAAVEHLATLERGLIELDRSGGESERTEATRYFSVRGLEADGDIEWYWGDETQGGRRKYFRITAKGKATYAHNTSNWAYAKRVLDNLL